jgi:hypothetical protein
MNIFNLYQIELQKLLKESKDKDHNWIGWYHIERLEEIIAKYKLFDKTS